MKEFYGGLIPHEDPRDFFAEHVLGLAEPEIKDSVKLPFTANNQQQSPQTRVACTCYSTYNVGNILNELEHQLNINQDPATGWELQKKFGTYTLNGDTLTTALKSIVLNGLVTFDKNYKIDAFARIYNDEIKSYLSKGMPIITYGPVSKTNFARAKSSGLYSPYDENPTVTYHAFVIIGYHDGRYVCGNSSGPTWGYFKDGTFEVDEKKIAQLGQKYIIFDQKDIDLIFRDVSTSSPYSKAIKACLDAGLLLGDNYQNEQDPTKRFFRPESPITRGELAVVLERLLKKIK